MNVCTCLYHGLMNLSHGSDCTMLLFNQCSAPLCGYVTKDSLSTCFMDLYGVTGVVHNLADIRQYDFSWIPSHLMSCDSFRV